MEKEIEKCLGDRCTLIHIGNYHVTAAIGQYGLYGNFFFLFKFHITSRTGRGLYQLLVMADAGGTRTCIHLHESPALPLCYG